MVNSLPEAPQVPQGPIRVLRAGDPESDRDKGHLSAAQRPNLDLIAQGARALSGD
jgi:hypothetical protein